MKPLQQGQVILAAVTDPHGENPKSRPAVILTATDEIAAAEEFVIAAISTKFSEPLPPDYVEVPWSGDGRAKTGLKEPSVVKCRWLKKVRRQEVMHTLGYVPAKIMVEIMRIVTKT